MKHVQDYAEVFANRLMVDPVSSNRRPADGEKLMALPMMRPLRQRTKPGTPEVGGHRGQSSQELPAQAYRATRPDASAVYRKWIIVTMAFCAVLLLISGVVAAVVDSGASQTPLKNLYARAALPPGSN